MHYIPDNLSLNHTRDRYEEFSQFLPSAFEVDNHSDTPSEVRLISLTSDYMEMTRQEGAARQGVNEITIMINARFHPSWNPLLEKSPHIVK